MFIEISNVKKHYGEGDSRVDVLKGIDIEVEKGEICVLLGPSGSGKSTLLNIIGGIDEADEGYISINGEKTANMNERGLTEYRRKHLGYVFQMYNLIPNLNIRENIEVGAYLSDKPPIIFNSVDLPEPDGPSNTHISPFSTSISIPFKTSTLLSPSP